MDSESSRPGAPRILHAPRIPADEGERLMALRGLGILDTPPEESFDRVTRLAAKALAVPIALVCLVDETRQWFKSRVGLAATQTSREVSFCGHAVVERKPLLIPDTTLDPRFAGNPLVTSAPHIRAYLGVPLYTRNRQPIGTLCALDVRPRAFGADETAILTDFAGIVQQLIHTQEWSAEASDVLQHAQDTAQLFRGTFDLATVGIVHTALSGHVIRSNQRISEMLGYSPEELRTLSFVDVTHLDDIPRNAQLFRQMVAGEIDSYRMEKRFIRKDGQYLWANLSAALRRSASGQPDHIIAFIEDIALQKRAQQDLISARDCLACEVTLQTEKLRERNEAMRAHVKQVLESERTQRAAERRLRTIANSIPAMIGYWNQDLRCEFANEPYRDWFGLGPDKIVGLHMKQLMGEALFALNEPHALAALAGKAQHFERRLTKIDGSVSFLDARYQPDLDETGAVRGFYVLVTDITALHTAQRELELTNAKLSHETVTDYLTGLSNRRVFSTKSEEASRRLRETGDNYALILLDLDDFKLINDRFGHSVGDEVLRAMGRILKEQVRGREDVVARLGGEEFALLCFDDLDEALLCQLAERIRAQIKRETVSSAKGLVQFTSSFGVARSYREDTDWKCIYARADAALYEAKMAGKDCVMFGRSAGKDTTGLFRSIRSASGA